MDSTVRYDNIDLKLPLNGGLAGPMNSKEPVLISELERLAFLGQSPVLSG